MSRWSRYLLLVLLLVALGASLGRRGIELLRQRLRAEVTVGTLNVQTLFDGEYDGGEFEEYNPLASAWSDAAYRERIEVLAEALREFTPRGAPDVLALQEIESARVLADLAAAFGTEHYPYLLCAPGPTAMRVCVASRFPLQSARIHALHASTEHPLRSSLEAQVDTPHGALTILVAHWKSRREGRAETDALRRLAARSTSRAVERLLDERPAARVIVAGDLNEEIAATSRILGPSPAAALRVAPTPVLTERSDGDVLYSPWHEISGGSYVFRGREQRIDHLLFSPGFFAAAGQGLAYRSVRLVDAWAQEDGSPARYERHLRRGVTDHFGLRATLGPADGTGLPHPGGLEGP